MEADILEDLQGLHEQATKERSHYYVAACSKRAIEEIGRLRDRLKQIAIVCEDNAGASHPALALKFVREIAVTK
jgi:hypothetical protein